MKTKRTDSSRSRVCIAASCWLFWPGRSCLGGRTGGGGAGSKAAQLADGQPSSPVTFSVDLGAGYLTGESKEMVYGRPSATTRPAS